jgi:RNA polymerase sigma-70 factor (ECF subfamily)
VIETGFGQAVAAAFPVLYRFAVALSSRDEADDLVQDALTRAWVKRDQYNATRGSMQSWLLAIVADQARKGYRRVRPDAVLVDVTAASSNTDGDVDLRRALQRLTKRQRTMVALHYYAGLSVAQIAEVMGCSAGTVKSTLADGRARLRQELGEDYRND